MDRWAEHLLARLPKLPLLVLVGNSVNGAENALVEAVNRWGGRSVQYIEFGPGGVRLAPPPSRPGLLAQVSRSQSPLAVHRDRPTAAAAEDSQQRSETGHPLNHQSAFL